MEGNLTESKRSFLKDLWISFDANSILIAIDSLLGFTQLYLKDDELEHVLELSYQILNHPSSTQEAKDYANALQTELETQLTPIEIEVIQVQAGEKTFHTVVQDLLM